MKQDDTDWLAGLFAEHSRAVRAYLFRRVPAEAVDDLVAEVFQAAWQSRGKVPEPALPWLYRTAANLGVHHRRSWARRTARERLAATEAVARDTTDQVADRVTIASAIDQLAEADAEVLRLVYWEDLSLVDTARVLGCTTGAARVRVHRARQRLQAVLGEPIGDPAWTSTLAKEEPS